MIDPTRLPAAGSIDVYSAQRPRPATAAATAGPARPVSAFSLTPAADVPSSPPPEVLQMLDRAAQVAQDLRAREVNLHFEVGTDDKIHVQQLDASGNVLREIPARKALDLVTDGGHILDEVA